jgi:hypothetical protein
LRKIQKMHFSPETDWIEKLMLNVPSESSILMLQNYTVVKYFRLELAEIHVGTWKQINNERLTPMRPAAYNKYRTVKSNYPVFLSEIYMKCISGTLFYAWLLIIFYGMQGRFVKVQNTWEWGSFTPSKKLIFFIILIFVQCLTIWVNCARFRCTKKLCT